MTDPNEQSELWADDQLDAPLTADERAELRELEAEYWDDDDQVDWYECSVCDGTGLEYDYENDIADHPCAFCNGRGSVSTGWSSADD